MLIHLHKQATTTPKVRAAIQASLEPASVLAERFGTTEQTIYKWRHRDSVLDRSHTAHRVMSAKCVGSYFVLMFQWGMLRLPRPKEIHHAPF